MDQNTIDKLLQINHRFYQTVAKDFNTTRQQPWEGWSQVLTELQAMNRLRSPFATLDLGCGNGRWGVFFSNQTKSHHQIYVGVDENQELLHYAARALLSHAEALHLLQQSIQSFITQPPDPLIPKSFDLIVLFGVWHHLPGAENRTKLLQHLTQLLQPQGAIVISCWRFRRSAALTKRLINPSDLQIDPATLEPGDYLLDWRSGEHAVRFCHDTQKDEIMQQANLAGLSAKKSFSADGTTGDLNDYYIFEKQ